jgi:O-antigen/teichoic acid export membrane protein
VGLVFGGQALVHCFYDARYQDAGWFLRVQAAGTVFSFLTMSYSGVLWVLNRPKLAALLLAVQTVFMVICILGGYWLGGVHGLVIGSAFTGVLLYPVSAYVYHHFGLFQPRVDMPIIAIGVCLALYLFLHGV